MKIARTTSCVATSGGAPSEGASGRRIAILPNACKIARHTEKRVGIGSHTEEHDLTPCSSILGRGGREACQPASALNATRSW